MAHDLVFWKNRSTPTVVTRGGKVEAKDGYGPQVRRRPATAEEEKKISSGQWLRVDQSGKKGGEPGYKKTQMKGRGHLVGRQKSAAEMTDAELREHLQRRYGSA